MASSTSITQAEQIIANHVFLFLEDCADWAEARMIFYKYAITLDSEVRLIWRRKITGANILFFFNRYLLVPQNALTVASFWPMSTLLVENRQACCIIGWMSLILSVLPYFVWNAFSTLRVYALSGRDWRFAALVCLLMTGPIVGNVYNLPTQKSDNVPSSYNCSVDDALTVAQHTAGRVRVFVRRLVLLSRCTIIAGDAVVLGVTWWRTLSIKKAADAAHIGTSLVALLLRGGIIYFGAMLLLNVLHILINFIEKVSTLGDIAHVLTFVLVSRFIMNLRDADGNGLHHHRRRRRARDLAR